MSIMICLLCKLPKYSKWMFSKVLFMPDRLFVYLGNVCDTISTKLGWSRLGFKYLITQLNSITSRIIIGECKGPH